MPDNDNERANWLDQFQYLLREAETPRRFIYWSGLATISAVVRDNVWLPERLYNLYPNIFVMMIGKSGLKKSFPVSKAKELVTLVNGTRVISGQNSIQGIVTELQMSKSDEKGNIPSSGSHAFIASEEFGDLIIEDPSAFTTLCNLFDRHYHKEYSRTLKNSPKQTLKNVTLTMLAASSPSYFKRAVPDIHITGGFLARFFVLYEDKKARLDALVRPIREDERETIYSPDKLLPHLQVINKLKGPFIWEDEKTIYDFENWYINFHKNEKGETIERDDETGYEDRVKDHILKVAMLMALSEPEPELVLKQRHIDKAREECLSLVANLHRATMATGKSPLAQAMQVVMKELIEHKEISREELLLKHYGEFTTEELDRVEATLEEAGLLEPDHIKGKTIYRLSKKGINYYNKKKAEKEKRNG